jgi:hypothetical protein
MHVLVLATKAVDSAAPHPQQASPISARMASSLAGMDRVSRAFFAYVEL